jgi:hypothetical protein
MHLNKKLNYLILILTKEKHCMKEFIRFLSLWVSFFTTSKNDSNENERRNEL